MRDGLRPGIGGQPQRDVVGNLEGLGGRGAVRIGDVQSDEGGAALGEVRFSPLHIRQSCGGVVVEATSRVGHQPTIAFGLPGQVHGTALAIPRGPAICSSCR